MYRIVITNVQLRHVGALACLLMWLFWKTGWGIWITPRSWCGAV